MTPEMKKMLVDARRALRTTASMMHNSRGGFAAVGRGAKDPEARAALQAYIGLLPETVAQLRSVADEADEYLRAGEITEDEWEALRQRLLRAFTQSGVMAREAAAAIGHPIKEQSE